MPQLAIIDLCYPLAAKPGGSAARSACGTQLSREPLGSRRCAVANYRAIVATLLGQLADEPTDPTESDYTALQDAIDALLSVDHAEELDAIGLAADGAVVDKLVRRKRFSWIATGSLYFLCNEPTPWLQPFEARFEPNQGFSELRSYEIRFGNESPRAFPPVWSHFIRYPSSPAA